MMINIGIDNRAKLSSLPKNISGIKAKDGAPSNIKINKPETTNKPTPTDMPENNIKMVVMPTKAPNKSGSITFLPGQKGLQFSI